MIARILFSIPNSLVGKRKYGTCPIPEPIQTAYKHLIYSLLSIPDTPNPQLIQYSSGAYKIGEEFFYEIEPQLKDDLEEIYRAIQ